jgi:NAD(P)-dependent dehydrogenase (short-subunit alcohol dehydrogenase family)
MSKQNPIRAHTATNFRYFSDRLLALEVAAEGIRVASVSPGLIDTELQLPERFARIAPTTPMQRAGTANEVAEAVVWLLSDKASYVTGADLAVTGGR